MNNENRKQPPEPKSGLKNLNDPQGFCTKISQAEWDRTHADFKTTIEKVHYLLRDSPQGAALVPVVIIP